MSTLTIELDSLTENRLQARSLQEQRNKEELAADLLATSLAASPAPKASEAELLEKINQGWNEQEWQRYHALVATRKDERLTAAEYQELCELTMAREVAHANRLRLVFELARLRNITLDEVMQQLGIGSNHVE